MNEKKTRFPQNDQDPLPPEAARQSRVNSIKEAVKAGTYRIETDRLADSLLGDLLWEEVLRNRRSPDDKE